MQLPGVPHKSCADRQAFTRSGGMKSIIVKFAVALASIAMLALFMWGFAEAFDAEMESHSKEYWERMEEER